MKLRAPPVVARTAAERQPDRSPEPPDETEGAPPNSLVAHVLEEERRDATLWLADWWQLTGGAPVPTEEAAPGEPGAIPGRDVTEEAEPTEVIEIEPEVAEAEPEKLETAPVAEGEGEVAAEAPPEALPGEAVEEAEKPEAEVPAPEAVAGAPEAAAPVADETAGLETWRAEVREATASRIRAPASPDPARSTAPVHAAGGRVVAREGARRRSAADDVRKAVPAAPELPEGLPPPPPIPVPAAEAAVAGATGKKLPPQTMPELQSYTHTRPRGDTRTFKAIVASRLPPAAGVTLAPGPPPAEAGLEGADAVARVRQAGKRVRKGAKGSGPLVLDTAPRAGAPGGPAPKPTAKADVARVLVRLRASVVADASAMLAAVRTAMYPHGALQINFTDLGATELLPGLQEAIGRALDSIATQAQLTADDLAKATAEASGTVVAQNEETKKGIDDARGKTAADVEKEGKDSADTLAGARDAAEDAIDEKAAAAEGGASPDAIRARRDRLVERVNRRLAPEDIRYEREGAERLQALKVVETGYIGGYQIVVRQVAEQIRRDDEAEAARAARAARRAGLPPPPPAPAPAPAPTPAPATPRPGGGLIPPIPFVPAATTPPTPAEQWGMDRVREAAAAFAGLKKQVTDTTAAFRQGIAGARTAARDHIYAWAETQIGERSSFWERLWEKIAFWRREAEVSTKAWEEARNAALHADLQGDMAFVNELASGARSAEEMRAMGAIGGLSDAQKAIVDAYFSGPEPRNPIAAIAAGMRVRIGEIQKPHLKEELTRMLYARPPADWDPVGMVAASEGGDFNIVERGNRFHSSVDQWGTDEDKLFAALTGLMPLQRHALDLWYQHNHGTTIDAELADELEDAELDRGRALMRGDEEAAEAAALNDAIAGAGTNEAEIWRALRNKTPEQMARIKEIYLEKYGESLDSALEDDLEDDELLRGQALVAGDVARADAIGLQAAMTGRWHGGADTDEVQAIYALNRAEAEAKAAKEGWTSEQLHAELLRRNQAIERAHGIAYPSESGEVGPGLQASFRAHLRGPELDLALGLATVDMARADAARLELERRSFVTDDDVVNGILESQFTRARTEVSLDLEHDLRKRRELAMIRGERWDEQREQDAMRGRIDDLAQQRSQGYMQALERQYDSKYSRWGSGGLQVLIAFNMSGPERAKARDLLAQGGRLHPEQEVLYAVEGVGTDVDALRALLKNKTPKEIKALEDAWKARYPDRPPLRERIMDEVSGRDAFDLDFMLEGAPETPEEKLALAKRRLKYEQEAYALGGSFSDREREMLELEVAKLERTVNELKTAPEGSERAAYFQWELGQRERAVESSIEEHRRSVDALADTAAMIAAITAAVLVTVLTAGTAAPAVVGAMAAIAATEATIITKLALKGSAYSEEELLVDVVSGVVDVAAAVLTAGVGNALLRAADGIPIGPLAKMATSSSTTKRMMARGLAEGVEGMIASVPSAAAGAFVDENTWRRGDPLANIGMAVGMGAGMGTLLSGGLGSLGGRAKPGAKGMPRLDPGRLPDLEAAARFADTGMPTAPVDPAGRAAQWRAHRAANPDARYDDFLRDLDAGRVAPDPSAAARFRQDVRTQLASGIPPAQRALLEGVPVQVLSDADFERFTRSATGQAVTIIERGRPRILMRESADVRLLREEGIHAVQALDRRTARAAAMLDEAHMARWDTLPLQTKIDMYRAKLGLEIDAQLKLAASLRRSLDDATPGVTTAGLRDQLDTALLNLRNLDARRVELAGFGPVDRLRAAFGRGPLAERLEQPPRLFAKGKPKKAGVDVAADTPGKRRKTELNPDRDVIEGRKRDPLAERSPLGKRERSPQQESGALVERVGPMWRETSFRGEPPTQKRGGDLYRIVEVTNPKTMDKVRIEETVVRGSDPPRWVKRGSESNEAGRVAEEASLRQTKEMIEKATRKGEKVVTLGALHQNKSLQGFDEVYFRFKPDGSVDVVLVEVKNYPGDWVPFEDFTAVTGKRLKKNLSRLGEMLVGPAETLPPGLRDLTPAQLKALRQKVAQATKTPSVVELEIRLGPGTKIGVKKVAESGTPTLPRLRKIFPNLTVKGIDPTAMKVATAAAEIGMKPPASGRFVLLHTKLTQIGAISPPVVAVLGERGVFRDAQGRVGLLRSPSTTELGTGAKVDRQAVDRYAKETVDALKREIQLQGSKKGLRVLLDLGGLDAETRRLLKRAIKKELEASGRRTELARRLSFVG